MGRRRCVIAGAGIANIVPILFSLAGDLPRPELQLATISTMGFIGLLAAPPIFGMIGQHFGLGTIFMGGAAGDAIIAALVLTRVRISPAAPASADIRSF